MKGRTVRKRLGTTQLTEGKSRFLKKGKIIGSGAKLSVSKPLVGIRGKARRRKMATWELIP